MSGLWFRLWARKLVDEELGAPCVHGSWLWVRSREKEVAGSGCCGLEEVFINNVTESKGDRNQR